MTKRNAVKKKLRVIMLADESLLPDGDLKDFSEKQRELRKTEFDVRDAIEAFIRNHNERAKPFKWRKREVKGAQLKNTIVNLRD